MKRKSSVRRERKGTKRGTSSLRTDAAVRIVREIIIISCVHQNLPVAPPLTTAKTTTTANGQVVGVQPTAA